MVHLKKHSSPKCLKIFNVSIKGKIVKVKNLPFGGNPGLVVSGRTLVLERS